MRQPGIAQQDIDNVLLNFALSGEFDRRQDERLLKCLCCGWVVVAGHRAANVVPMSYTGEVAEELSIPEIGAHEAHVA